MKRRNQLNDLRRLISLPSKDMKRQYYEYIYEETSSVLSMLFGLTQSNLNRHEKNNILTLLKYLLEGSDEFHSTIPDWMVSELNNFIKNPLFSDHEKAIVLSTFAPEELFDRVLTFERFVQRFMDIKESFEDYIVREIKDRRSRLYDIFITIREKTKQNVIKSMINDLKDSRHTEATDLLEMFTYVENPDISLSAFDAIRESKTSNTVGVLYSISKLNPAYQEKAQTAYIEMIKANPVYRRSRKQEQKGMEFMLSMADGNGSFSAIIGARMRRNEYLFANFILKAEVGIKDVSVFSALPLSGYKEIRKEYREKLNMYRVSEVFFKKVLRHFAAVSLQKGFGLPVEIIALKNILRWKDLEPEKFMFARGILPVSRYGMADLEKFPFETWWMNDNSIYKILYPYREADLNGVPERILEDIAGIYLEFARRQVVPLCEICAGIYLDAYPERGRRLAGIFNAVRNEIIEPPGNLMDSLFISFQTINTVYNTLCNLAAGMNSIEFC